MLTVLATAGGFGGHFDARPGSYTFAPDAGPKLAALLLVAIIVLWLWRSFRARTLGR